jgi:predicted ArsR family transcriptional regulator
MSGRASISAYTPSNTDPEVLKRIFVQRERLLEKIVERLARSMNSGDKHHALLIGPRGSGKTHLVSLAVHELQGRPDLSDRMRIAWLGEDDTFAGLIDIALGIADQLAVEYADEFATDYRTPVRGLPPDDAAISILNAVVERLEHRNIILITENMDRTFDGLGDLGQKKWRAFLQETPRIATLATSQQLFAGVADRKEAFFGFFDIHHLKPLSVDDARELIRRISVEQGKTDLVSFLNSSEGRYRIRALHHLAGGNHRMYVLLAEFLTKDLLDDLIEAFEDLAEDLTPYFQERLGSLPAQQAKLVQCLCNADGAMTVKDIAEESFVAERNCSKQLGSLRQKGYVQSEKRGKESYYDMAEPLMRLCLEVKNQRGRPLKLVARFLRAWFPETSLQKPSVEHGETSQEDFETALTVENASSQQRTEALFALPEPMIAHSDRSDVVEALASAFEQGDSESEFYGGTPNDLLSMVLRRGHQEWAPYIAELAPLYIKHDSADKLGTGVAKSIEHLDTGEYSETQLDIWNAAWQEAGKDCDELEIPLRCLDAAVEVIKTKSDRPLFRLPLEIREIVRPLLKNSLAE